jgi:hypothetical protein
VLFKEIIALIQNEEFLSVKTAVAVVAIVVVE